MKIFICFLFKHVGKNEDSAGWQVKIFSNLCHKTADIVIKDGLTLKFQLSIVQYFLAIILKFLSIYFHLAQSDQSTEKFENLQMRKNSGKLQMSYLGIVDYVMEFILFDESE